MTYFTICARNYLAYARTLRESLKAVEPAARFWTVLIEEPSTSAEPIQDVIYARDLGIPGFWDMALRYSVMELATAIKPFVFLHLLRQGDAAAVYLDPDIQILRPLTEVHELLEQGANCVLTPHSTRPLDDGGDPDDARLLRTGVYNLGFAAFRHSPQSLEFLEWWARRCQTDCRVALEEGLFVDQKFMDLAPAYLEACIILRDAGYNVAYWNLPNRALRHSGGVWQVNGRPLVFFHFSGVDPRDGSVFSKHQDRYTTGNVGQAARLLRAYLARLKANGQEEFSTLPYSYGCYSDGVRIPDFARQVYAESHPKPVLALSYEQAFNPEISAADGNALAAAAARLGGPPVTRLAYAIWRGRRDLRAAFSLDTAESAWRYSEWFVENGAKEHQIPEMFIRPVQAALARRATSPAAPVARLTVRESMARAILAFAPRFRRLYLKASPRLREPIKRALLRTGYGRSLAPQHAIFAASAPVLDEGLAEGVTLAGYLRAESGLGAGARRAAEALQAAGVPLTTVALPAADAFEETQAGAFQSFLGGERRRILITHVNADQTPLLPHMMDMAPYAATYRVGYWVWELPRLPRQWAAAADPLHEIWTPSEYSKAAIEAEVDRPVIVVPHAVPVPAAPPTPCASDVLRFATIFDFRSYMSRKNPEAVIRAFRDAFPTRDKDVSLVIKAHGGHRRPSERHRLLQLIADDPRMTLDERVLDDAALDRFRASMDCFVSLHRAEGFGLNVAEAMAWGRPVISTDYSATAEFVDAAVGFPVAATTTAVPHDAYPGAEGQVWAEPGHDAAVAAFRAVHADPAAASARGRAARERIVARFSAPVVGSIMKARLDHLNETLPKIGDQQREEA